MSEIGRRIAQAGAHVEPTWTPEREARVRAAVGRGLQRRQRQRTGFVIGLGACTLLVGFLLGRQPGSTARRSVPEGTERVAQPSLLQLPDGTSVHADSADARVDP